MTHKKLLNQIIEQTKENTQQISETLREQIDKQINERNNAMLSAFTQCYEKAISNFTEKVLDCQKEQNTQMLNVMNEFISGVVKNQDKMNESFNMAIKDMKNEHDKQMNDVNKILLEIKQSAERQNNVLNDKIAELVQKNGETCDFVKGSIGKLNEMAENIKKTNTDSAAYNAKTFKNGFEELQTILNRQSENQENANDELKSTLNNTIKDSISDMSDKINEALGKLNEMVENIKKTNTDSAVYNSTTFKNSFKELQTILNRQSENQENANDKLKSSLNNTIKGTIEVGIYNMSDKINETFKEHQHEILSINKKIQEITNNYSNQLKLLSDSINKNQELSSKDVKILEGLVKGR